MNGGRVGANGDRGLHDPGSECVGVRVNSEAHASIPVYIALLERVEPETLIGSGAGCRAINRERGKCATLEFLICLCNRYASK